MINSNLNPDVWADWLQKIKESTKHNFIVKDKINSNFEFLNNKEANNSSKDILNVIEILSISKKILKISILFKYLFDVLD